VDAVTNAGAAEGRRERRKRELRARIYATARRLFREQGVDATTVEQIAAATDIVPATFFNHFQSKQALLGEMTSEVVDHLQGLIEQRLLRPGSAQARIRAFADQAANEIHEARSAARDVLLEFMRTRTRPGEAAPYLARVHGPFAKILREGQAKGEVRTDLGAPFLAEMVAGAFNAVVIHWMSDPDYPLEQRFRQVADFLGEAIRPLAKGPRVAAGRRSPARGAS
jgi:AcrR family transcriptional regulator